MILNRVAVAVLLLAVVGVAGCGDDQPTQPAVEVPPWAKVAPEQIAEAKKHGVPVAFENDLGMRFVLIPAGTFLMGSPEGEKGREDDEAQHEVTLTRPYYMQITETTVGAFHHFRWNRGRPESDMDHLNRLPVANDLPWALAVQFARWLSEKDAVREYRLPTEAEWEFACRAGTTTPFSTGTTITKDDANFHGGFSYPPTTPRSPGGFVDTNLMPSGSFPANAWGLQDMHGNVAEWCHDWFASYPSAPATDPTGPSRLPGDALRVVRGGLWSSRPEQARSASRLGAYHHSQAWGLGFRLVSPLPAPKGGR